jgi:hypothetical protein
MADNMIGFAAGMVQNDYPGMPVDEVLDWKKETLRMLEGFNEKYKKLVGITLEHLIVDGEDPDDHLMEDDVPY